MGSPAGAGDPARHPRSPRPPARRAGSGCPRPAPRGSLAERGVVSSSSSTIRWSKRVAISAADVGAFGEQAVEGEEDVAAVEASGLGEDAVVGRVELGELEFAPGGLPLGFVARRPRASRARSLQPRRPEPFRLQRVDPLQQARQQAGRVAADLVAAQRQLVEPVEQHRQPLGRPEHVEEGIEAGGLGVLAQQPLADRPPRCRSRAPRRARRSSASARSRSRRAVARVEAMTSTRSGAVALRGQPRQAPRQQPRSCRSRRRRATSSGPVAVGDRALLPSVSTLPSVDPRASSNATRGPAIASGRWTFSPQTGWESAAASWPRSERSSTRRASIEARTVYEGVGEGGDRTLAIDRRCEDAVFAELEALAAAGRLLRRRLRGARRGRASARAARRGS